MDKPNNYKHGYGGKEKLYSVWSNMKNRCNNPRCKDYKYYGERGIKVCEEWNEYMNFRNWAYQNGYKEGVGLSIDRIDHNGPYTPDNCRWANRKIQANNMSSNHLITIDGETKTLTEWAESYGLKPRVVEARIQSYGWDVIEALTTPANAHRSWVVVNGEPMLLAECARKYHMCYATLYNRTHTYGMSIEDAISKPINFRYGVNKR